MIDQPSYQSEYETSYYLVDGRHIARLKFDPDTEQYLDGQVLDSAGQWHSCPVTDILGDGRELNAAETRELGSLICRVRDTGVTVVLVEHDMTLTMEICDDILVMDYGRTLAEGSPREIQQNQAVIAAYLGEEPVA